MPGNLLGEDHPSWSLVTPGVHSSLVNSPLKASQCFSLWHPAFPGSQNLSRHHPSSAPWETASPSGRTKHHFPRPVRPLPVCSALPCVCPEPAFAFPRCYPQHPQRLKDNTLTGCGHNWICCSKLDLEQDAGEQIVIFKMHSGKPALSHVARKGLQLITDNWGKLCWTEASRLL